MAEKMNFTIQILDKARCPDGKRQHYLYDDKVRGLALRIMGNSGVKTFCFCRKLEGRSEKIALGRYPDLKLKEARKEAARKNAFVAEGKPIRLDRQARADKKMALGKLFNLFLEGHGKVRKRSWKGDQYNYEKHLKRWASRRLESIDRADVAALHARIGKKGGPYIANRVLALLRKLYNHASDLGLTIENPALRVKPFKEEKRARFLGSRESDNVEKFFRVVLNWPADKPQDEKAKNEIAKPENLRKIREQDEKARDVVLLAILTGARKSNLLTMRWDEVSLEVATWTIPGRKSKSGEPITIPLSGEALEILRNRKELVNGKGSVLPCPWVFPGRTRKSPLTSIRNQWGAMRATAGFETSGPNALRFHDLRRTLGSFQAMSGSSLLVIGKSLGHRSSASTEIYSRLKIDPVRESVERATSMLFDLAKVERKEADIVEAVGEK